MKAALWRRTDGSPQRVQKAHERPAAGSARAAPDVDARLWSEISRLGGEERRQGAEGALKAFQDSLAELVRQQPAAYGAGDDPKSQQRVVNHLLESVSHSFLLRTTEALRHKAGYVLVCGRWIHRAVFTFIGFGILAAIVLPLCAVSVMSTSAWGWVPGALGIAAALGAGAWILSRIGDRGGH